MGRAGGTVAQLTSVKAPLPASALMAAAVSAAMIAQQVAGKAARDALFLSLFPVTTLPWLSVMANAGE